MPALVNYSGEYELYSRQSICSSDLGSLNDIYCSPRKRPRIDMPYVNNRVMYKIIKKPSIEVLPDECLFEIFKRLPGARERSVSAFVSKRWLALLSSMRASDINMTLLDANQEEVCGSYIERSLEGKKATDTRLYGISIGTSRHGGLRKLSIRGSNVLRGVTNSGLSAIGHGCPFLKELFLWNISTIDDEGLVEIARGCRLLERFDLCQCPNVTDKGLAALAEKCPNLSTLSIESCFSICNKGLKAIGKHCPKLQSISIKNCPLIGDEGIAGILSSNSTILKTIKFQGLNVSDISLALIGHYGLVVTDLVLSGLQKVSQRGFWTMAKANGLHLLASLTLTSCQGVTDMSIEAMAKGCPNLKHVCLRKCCFVSDNGLVAFTKSAQLLESLQLEECNRISQTGVLGALTHCSSKFKSFSIVKCLGLIKNVYLEEDQTLFPCQSLRSLSIRYCPGFTTGTLAMVMKLCPQLRHLDLSGLHMITDEAIMPFIETCEAGLIKVNLKDCKKLTDESISVLARLHGKTLQFLNLDGCRNVTDASLNAIAYYCIVINELDVSKCSITDSGVAALCDEVHSNLQTLSISGCSMVSDKSCGYLKMLSETLSALNIRNCNSLSSSGVEQLIEELWRCDIFS